MCGSIWLVILFSIASIGVAKAQDPIPTMLYNPATGGIFFDNLDVILDVEVVLLSLESAGGHLSRFIPSALTHSDQGLELEKSIPSPNSSPPVTNSELFAWRLEGPYGSPIMQPAFAGNIVHGPPVLSPIFNLRSEVDISDLTFTYYLSPGTPLPELVVQIPEPSTAVLFLCCIMPALARRQR